jgi:hypothetical protein
VSEQTRGRCSAWVSVALIATVITAGCASAGPLATNKVWQAQRAVDEAENAGAATDAAGELRAATDKLKDAQAALTNRDYDRAIRSADMALTDADYARALDQSARHEDGR